MVSNEKERLTITLPKELIVKIREAANDERRNISNFLTVLIENNLISKK